MFDQLIFIKLCALLGWAIALLAVASRPFRTWLTTQLQMPAPTTNSKLVAIDALRGLAALWVALFHYWQWTRPYLSDAVNFLPIIVKGNKAVPVFVILSGFLIWRSVKQIKTIADLSIYVRNRIFRLYPLYAVATLVIFATGQFGVVMEIWRQIPSEFLMARTFGSQAFLMPQNWSLYVEVIFYLAAPCLVLAFDKKAIPLAMIGIFGFVLTEYPDCPRELALWKFFFFGILAAEIQKKYAPLITSALAMLLFSIGVILFGLDAAYEFDLSGAVARGFSIEQQPGPDASPVMLGIAFFLILIGILNSPILSQLSSFSLLRVLGIVSYSVFMWHGFLICLDFPLVMNGAGNISPTGPSMPWPYADPWTLFGIIIPGLFGIGIVSFLCIERPFLRLRPSKSRIAATMQAEQVKAAP